MNCCVIVEPPWTTFLFWTSAQKARADRAHVDAAVLVEALVLDRRRSPASSSARSASGSTSDAALGPAQDGEDGLPVLVVDEAVVRALLLARRVELRDLAGDRGHSPNMNEANESRPSTAISAREAELADPARPFLRRAARTSAKTAETAGSVARLAAHGCSPSSPGTQSTCCPEGGLERSSRSAGRCA